MNKILLGPTHTLHSVTGQLATQLWWQPLSYPAYFSSLNISQYSEEVFQFESFIRTRLKQSKYKEQIEAAMIQYVEALDDINPNNSFLALWSLLERLTGTGINDGHNVTVKRAAFLYEEAEYHTQILNHLRIQRNYSVHSGTTTTESEVILFQLKRYVEELIKFHILNKWGFMSFEEAAMLLGKPTSRDELIQSETSMQENIEQTKKNIKLTKAALDFRFSN